MSDYLKRLIGRAMGEVPTVEPLVGTRFGKAPELVSEQVAPEETPQNGSGQEAEEGASEAAEGAGER